MEKGKRNLFVTKIIAESNEYHVNNVTYLQYLEQARREIYAFYYAHGIVPLVAHLSVDYKREVFNKETLTIRTKTEKIGNTSVTLKQEIYTEKNELALSATVVLVAIHATTREKVTVPDAIREKLFN